MPNEQRRHTIIRLPRVKSRTGLSRAGIYAGMTKDAGDPDAFPKSVPIGPRAVGWIEDEIDAWVARRIERRDAGTARRSLGLERHQREQRARKQTPQRRRITRETLDDILHPQANLCSSGVDRQLTEREIVRRVKQAPRKTRQQGGRS